MFKRPFSFEGRIRRLEYGLSLIIYVAVYLGLIVFMPGIADDTSNSESSGSVILFFLMVPALWFLWAQGCKRCHDMGKSGWFQLIPFYYFIMLFQDGERGENEYGLNPKGIDNFHDAFISEEPRIGAN